MQSTITKTVLNYQKNKYMNTDNLIKEISLRVYNYPYEKYSWTRDLCSDFYCFFYPRIFKLINNFNYQGKDFEAYLNSSIRWQCKTFLNSIRQKQKHNKIFINPDFWNLRESMTYYTKNRNPKTEKKQIDETDFRKTEKRRLLYLILKESNNLDKFNMTDLAKLTNIKVSEIEKLIAEIKTLLDNKRGKLQHLKHIRNKYFFKIFKLHEDLSTELIEENKCKLTKELIKTKEKMNKTILNISSMKMSPDHKDIARLLKIPKGTVDSGIYYIKQNLLN